MNYHKGLNITDEEKELIEEVKKNVEENNRKKKKNEKKEKVWDHANLTELKSRIKQHYRNNMGELCCYCRKNFHGEFNMVIDIEHILPKKHFEMFEFTDFNLSIACKRCNMNVKGEDINFIIDLPSAHDNPTDVDNYKFIHPNLDAYEKHLNKIELSNNGIRLIKYTVVDNSNKGSFTYSYMELDKLEALYMNTAQGLRSVDMSNINEVAEDIRKQIIDILKI